MIITYCDKCNISDKYEHRHFKSYLSGKNEITLCIKCSDELGYIIGDFMKNNTVKRSWLRKIFNY